jgi:SAM-dependent methyltransferase
MSVMVGTAAHQETQWSKDTLAWASLHEVCLKPLWLAILKTGCVGWRTRFLDIGCGTGGALMLGRGLGAALAGIDENAERVRFAMNRVRRCDIRAASLARLPFADDCANFVMSTDLVSNPRNGVGLVKEMCRVCGPKGKLAVATWGDPERCDIAGTFHALGMKDGFLYGSEPALSDLVQNCCGKVELVSECESEFVYPSIEAAWVLHRNLGWGAKAVEEMGLNPARTAFLGAMRRHADPSGRVVLRNHFRFAILRKD